MRVLVTGGAGFIGTHVCAEMLARGASVIVLDDLSTCRRDNLAGLPVDLSVGCVTDAKVVTAAASGADAIVHLAAIASVPFSIDHPARTHRVNVTGTLNVLEAAREEAAHVVVASSAAVYGDHPAPLKSETLTPRPLSPYAATKLAAEAYAMSWQRSLGVPVLTFRFFNVFGPLQPPDHAYAAVVPAFVAAAVADRPLQVFGDGKQSRDFVPVGTVARVLADAVERRVTYPTPVNLALGGKTTVAELADTLEVVLRRPLARQYAEPRVGDVRDSRGDDALLRRLFPDLPPLNLAAALREAVGWWQLMADRSEHHEAVLTFS